MECYTSREPLHVHEELRRAAQRYSGRHDMNEPWEVRQAKQKVCRDAYEQARKEADDLYLELLPRIEETDAPAKDWVLNRVGLVAYLVSQLEGGISGIDTCSEDELDRYMRGYPQTKSDIIKMAGEARDLAEGYATADTRTTTSVYPFYEQIIRRSSR